MNDLKENYFMGNGIKHTSNDYQSFTSKYYPSKKSLLNKNRANNYNPNKYSTTITNNLQNRINNSLFPSRKNYRSKNSLKNINPFLNNLKPFSYTNLIDDLKTTLMKTNALTKKINSNSNFHKNNFRNNKFSLRNKYNSKLSSSAEDDSFSLEEMSDFSNGLDDKATYKKKLNKTNLYNNDDNVYKKNKFEKYEEPKQTEEDKLKQTNLELKKSNQDLRNQNRILEVEISNYKAQESKLKYKKTTDYDEKLKKFITSLKESLKESINNNIKSMDQIFNCQKENLNMYNKNKSSAEEHMKLANKIEEDNRKKAEIQIFNEENENKVNTLTDEKFNLNNELEKLKTELNKLKNDENILKIENDSKLKGQKDNQELIKNLNKTINQLNQDILESSGKSHLNTKKNESMMNNLSMYNSRINELKNILESKTTEKINMIQKISNLKFNLNTKNKDMSKTSLLGDKNLKDEFNRLKMEYQQIQSKISEKEKEIQILKQYLEKARNALKKDDYQAEFKKMNIAGIIKENEEEELMDEMNMASQNQPYMMDNNINSIKELNVDSNMDNEELEDQEMNLENQNMMNPEEEELNGQIGEDMNDQENDYEQYQEGEMGEEEQYGGEEEFDTANNMNNMNGFGEQYMEGNDMDEQNYENYNLPPDYNDLNGEEFENNELNQGEDEEQLNEEQMNEEQLNDEELNEVELNEGEMNEGEMNEGEMNEGEMNAAEMNAAGLNEGEENGDHLNDGMIEEDMHDYEENGEEDLENLDNEQQENDINELDNLSEH